MPYFDQSTKNNIPLQNLNQRYLRRKYFCVIFFHLENYTKSPKLCLKVTIATERQFS